jgi:pimeloyl-ACP methyl ester carboxylesterase
VLEVFTHNWALFSILATVAVLIVVPALVLRKYVRIIINIFDDTPPPLSMDSRDYIRLPGEDMSFRAFDGHALRGLRIPANPSRGPRGMIIFAHEFGSDAESCARYCRPLIEAGYDVFSFDFRGHGRSSSEEGFRPRQWPSDREVADMLGAIAFIGDWLEDAGRPPQVGLFGISRGAGAAILAAQDGVNVKCIVTDGAFSSDTTLEYLMKRWAKIFAKVRVVYENHPPQFWRFLRWLLFRECQRRYHCRYPSVRKALMRLRDVSILMIHGEKDSYIPVSQTQMLYGLASQPKYMWIVPGAKHNQCVMVQPSEYAARTVAFFDKHLACIQTPVEIFCSEPHCDLTQPLAEPMDATKRA